MSLRQDMQCCPSDSRFQEASRLTKYPSSPSSDKSLSIPSCQILSLIHHHLAESSLLNTCRTLRQESGVACMGLTPHLHSNLKDRARNGQWGDVLEILTFIDFKSIATDTITGETGSRRKSDLILVAEIHEMCILELAHLGETELAFTTLRLCIDLLDSQPIPVSLQSTVTIDVGAKGDSCSWSMNLKRRIHLISKLRYIHDETASGLKVSSIIPPSGLMREDPSVPPDYYGPGQTRQKRRDDIASRLSEAIPIAPSGRLLSLLQQSLKWQVFTGVFPTVRELYEDERDSEYINTLDKRKKLKHHQQSKKKRFDLVLGQIDAPNVSVRETNISFLPCRFENIPRDPWSTLKFTKGSMIHSCLFIVNASFNSFFCASKYKSDTTSMNQNVCLVTGSSDGFIEIWGSQSKFTDLRLDLEYQKNDEIMCHSGVSVVALAASRDGTILVSGDSNGTIKVWRISSGQCLREFVEAHNGYVSDLDFCGITSCSEERITATSSLRILSCGGDGSVREWGMRSGCLLKEFQGHTSFVNTCHYIITDIKNILGYESAQDSNLTGCEIVTRDRINIITGSADGTVRLWDGKSAECIRIIEKSSFSPSAPLSQKSSILSIVDTNEKIVTCVKGESTFNSIKLWNNILAVMPLHTPADTVIVLPRGNIAYLIRYNGVILRTYRSSDYDKKKKKTFIIFT